MSTKEPFIISDQSPNRLKKLLIKNPYLPTFYENLRQGLSLCTNIRGLEDDDPLIEFILAQLEKHELIEKDSGGQYCVKYSRIVPPKKWGSEEEGLEYVDSILSYAQQTIKVPSGKKVSFGHYTGSLSEADYSSMIERLVAVIDSYNDKPDGPVNYQTTFVSKQL